MTSDRIEIELQGSNDLKDWKTYEFKYKPGNLTRPPPFTPFFHPRVDWQLWFNSGGYQRSPWIVSLVVRVLEGSSAVMELFETNPFPDDAPPKFLRALSYRYRFTDIDSKDWWKREYLGEYLVPISLENPSVSEFLKAQRLPLPKKRAPK